MARRLAALIAGTSLAPPLITTLDREGGLMYPGSEPSPRNNRVVHLSMLFLISHRLNTGVLPFLGAITILVVFAIVGCSEDVSYEAEYWSNGQMMSEEGYIEDSSGRKIKQGRSTHWYRNGQKKLEIWFKNGLTDGPQVCWHENGKKALEGLAQAGKSQGRARTWYPNGQLEREGFFLDGVPEGRLTIWYAVRIRGQIFILDAFFYERHKKEGILVSSQE